MKKRVLIILLFSLALILLFILSKSSCRLREGMLFKPAGASGAREEEPHLNQAFEYLRVRRDKEAQEVFARLLEMDPSCLDCRWAEAEILRRRHEYQRSEELFRKVLEKDPGHIPSLIGLSYVLYKADDSKSAQKILDEVLKKKGLKRQDEAFAYMVRGAVNSGLAKKGFFSRIKYGVRIKGNFLKAASLAPEMPEVHLALGSFYLFAPAIVGGDLDAAIKELETALSLAPDFATACGRLAQAYAVKGDLVKYELYLERARELDPENETLKEIR
ncbi:MAG: tetratricopeptide repeat protein [Candidatus Omnitrophica bacterium]|nr:tetratricopeptide repeat protein [Candidatus Omnitrophota bacterium]